MKGTRAASAIPTGCVDIHREGSSVFKVKSKKLSRQLLNLISISCLPFSWNHMPLIVFLFLDRQEVLNKCHRAQKVIVKKKRGFAYVRKMQKTAAKNGQLGRIRKLRVVRRTRFNSRIRVLDSFLLNAPLVRRLLTIPAFAETLKLRNPRKREAQESSLSTWKSDTIFHRARRALLVCGPAAILTRLTGAADFFACYPAWLRCCHELKTSQEGSSEWGSVLFWANQTQRHFLHLRGFLQRHIQFLRVADAFFPAKEKHFFLPKKCNFSCHRNAFCLL